MELLRDPPQGERVVAGGGERDRQDRDIVDGTRLDEGGVAPGGIRSKLADIFWFRRTMLFSSSCPTLNRTIAIDCPGDVVE